MGIVLMIIGLGWAALGGVNIVYSAGKMPSETALAFAIILNMALFILPGLVVGGIGRMLYRRHAGGRGTRLCPACAESVKATAKVCRFCGRDLPVLAPAIAGDNLTYGCVALAFLLTAAPAFAEEVRVDRFSADSERRGYAIIDRERGTIDTYDAQSRRTGYGVIRPDGSVDRYNADSSRRGTIRRPRK